MSPRRRQVVLALAAALAGTCSCERKQTPGPATHDAGGTAIVAPPSSTSVATGEPPSPPTSDAAPVAAVGAGPRWAFDCSDVGTPSSGKPIGHTSVVFKVELSNGKKAAWKPNARKVKERYRGEVAAYRLAVALGLENVPPACLHAVDAAHAASALAANAAATKMFADEVLVERGKVDGVVIPWIDGLRFWPLEKEPLRSEARAWLTSGSELPSAKADLARQASTLVAFDFLTGNWDRYSGENVGLDRTGTHVLYIDNDAAFMASPPSEGVTRNKARLESVDRFSRGLVARLRGLDTARLLAALGEDAAGKPLLAEPVVAIVVARVKELLAVVDAKITKRGEAETLYFP